MDINWLGHSCFRIKNKETIIVTDPPHPDYGYSLNKIQADIVTISHFHPGHSYTEAIDGDFRVIQTAGEYELRNVFITGIATSHDTGTTEGKGKNTVYLLEIDGVTLCHLGDIGQAPSSKVEEEMGDIGVLFVPVGGVSTIDGAAAAEIVRSLVPKIVIPMHYKTPASLRDLDTHETFLKKLGIKDIAPQPKLTVTRSNLPASTQVVVLDYPNR